MTLLGTGNGSISGVISASSGSLAVTKDGAGTWTLSGANTYTDATTINANGGTLKLDNNNTTTARLANTSGITVNSGGTLLLAQSSATASTDRINNSATVNLGGGTFNTVGLNEGPADGATGASAAMGQLTLSVNSTIDFSSGNTAHGSNLFFASLNSTIGSNISIKNWTGTVGADNGNAGNDRLLFSSNPNLSDTQLASLRFYDDNGNVVGSGGTEISFNGYTEIVAAVPEPTTIFGALALLGMAGYRERRRIGNLLGVLSGGLRVGYCYSIGEAAAVLVGNTETALFSTPCLRIA